MQLNRLKVFYIALSLFFVLGAFVTAYMNGQQMESIPDTSWQTPEYFIGYFNNYLNQKVNPMTLGDVFVTEYIEHPDESTGVVPLYPTQTVIQERAMINCSITEIETYLIPDDNNTYGTTVGIGFYVKRGEAGGWQLEGYDTVSTAGDASQAIKVVIETPRTSFGAEGGRIRVVITNFGTEINEAVYVPTIIDSSDRSSFSGMNTVVDAEEALFLTIKNKYQLVKGYRYYVDYERFVGIKLHRVAYKLNEDKDIALRSNEIIAIFNYPTLLRKDSITNRYSSFRTMIDQILPNLDPQLVTKIEDLLVQIPIIGSFFKYDSFELDLSYSTSSYKSEENIQDFADRLVQSSQNDLAEAAQPAIQTMLLTRDIDVSNPSDNYEMMDYFNRTFVSDYNELETYNQYTFTQVDFKTYKLALTGQQTTTWMFDLTKSVDNMITELNPIPGREDIEGQSFRWLLNKLNKEYYSSQELGTTGLKNIKQRGTSSVTIDRNSGKNFQYLVKQVENIAVPDYKELTIISEPSIGKFTLVNKKGMVVQKYDMMHDGELAGQSVSLLESQTEKIFLWLQKTFGPWSNIQVPDERPVWEWQDLLYTMDDDRDESGYFLGGSTSNINSLNYNGVERPLDFTIETEDTARGWYRGDMTYGYNPTTLPENIGDEDWDTPGMVVDVGVNKTIDIEIVGGYTNYWDYYTDSWAKGHFLDNNGWVMLDLGDEVPGEQWRLSFDFWKNESDPSNEFSAGYYGSGAGLNCPDECAQADFYGYNDTPDTQLYYDAGIGVALTNDIGIKQLVERHDIDLYIPIQIDHVQGRYGTVVGHGGLPPDDVISLSVYDPFYIMNKTHGFDSEATIPTMYFPGGTLATTQEQILYHQMNYAHTLKWVNGGNFIEDFNEGGILYLEPMSWHHVDFYYDGVTGLLNIFIDDQLVRANLYMPELNSKNDPTLENIWFYNYGMQTTYISNLEVSEQIPPMIVPFKSSVVNIGRLTSNQGLTNPTIIKGPYQYGYTTDGSYSLWPETNIISECWGSLYDDPCDLSQSMEIGQTVNLGLGTQEMIYWVDVDTDGTTDPAEFTPRDANYLAKYATIANMYTDSQINYQGLIPLLGDSGETIWDRINYADEYYTVGAGTIVAGEDSLDNYPPEGRFYERLIEMDDFELLLLGLLQTDYEFDTSDFYYPDEEEVYHEVLWGEAVNDIIDNGKSDVLEMTGWGKVLLSLISIVDAASVYKVSPLWNDQTETPTVMKTTQSDFNGFYGHDVFTVEQVEPGVIPDDMDRYWTLGYSGVVSYNSGGSSSVSSFYGGDSSENVTYGGRKWYTFGLNVSDLLNYNLANKGGSLIGTPYEGYDDISEKRLIIQGAREFLDGSADFETYSLNLITIDLDDDQTLEEIVVPIKWSDENTIEIIYEDPTDLFVRLEDKDSTGYFERYYTGPLGKYLQPKYMLGNILEYMDMSNPDPISVSSDWIMESISGLVNGFIEALPFLTELFSWITSITGIGEILKQALFSLTDIWEEVTQLLLIQTELNKGEWVFPDDIDIFDGTYLDDGEKRVNADGDKDIAGENIIRWGVANNGLNDDYDQGILNVLNFIPMILKAFVEVLSGESNAESSGLDLISEAMFKAYNEIEPTEFIGYQSDYTLETAHGSMNDVLALLYKMDLVKTKKTRGGIEYIPIDGVDLGDHFITYDNGEWSFVSQGYDQILSYIKQINGDEEFRLEDIKMMIGATGRGADPQVMAGMDIGKAPGFTELWQTLIERTGGAANIDESRSRILAGLIDWKNAVIKISEDGSGDPTSWEFEQLPVKTIEDILRDPSLMKNGILGIADENGNIMSIEQLGMALNTARSDSVRETVTQLLNTAFWAAAAGQTMNDETDIQGITSAAQTDMMFLSQMTGEFGEGNFIPIMPAGFVNAAMIMVMEQVAKARWSENVIPYRSGEGYSPYTYYDLTKYDVLGGTKITGFILPVGRKELRTIDGGVDSYSNFPLLLVPNPYSYKRFLFDNRDAPVPYRLVGDDKIPILQDDLVEYVLLETHLTQATGTASVLMDAEIISRFLDLPLIVYDPYVGFKTTQEVDIRTNIAGTDMKDNSQGVAIDRLTGAPTGSRFVLNTIIKKFQITSVDNKGNLVKEYVFLTQDDYDAVIDYINNNGPKITKISPTWAENKDEYMDVLPDQYRELYLTHIVEFMKTEIDSLDTLGRLENNGVTWVFDPNARDAQHPNGRWFRCTYNYDEEKWESEQIEIYYSEFDETEGDYDIPSEILGEPVDAYVYDLVQNHQQDTDENYYSETLSGQISMSEIENIHTHWKKLANGPITYQPTADAVWSSVFPLTIESICGRTDLWKYDTELGMFVNPKLVELLGGSLLEFLSDQGRYRREIAVNTNPVLDKPDSITVDQLARVRPTTYYKELISYFTDYYKGTNPTQTSFVLFIYNELIRRGDERVLTLASRQGLSGALADSYPVYNHEKSGFLYYPQNEDIASDTQLEMLMANTYANPKQITLPYDLYLGNEDGSTDNPITKESTLFEAIQKWNEKHFLAHPERIITTFDNDGSKRVMTDATLGVHRIPMSLSEVLDAGFSQTDWENASLNDFKTRKLAFMQMWGIIQGFNDTTYVYLDEYGNPMTDPILSVTMRRTHAQVTRELSTGKTYQETVLTDAMFGAVYEGEESKAVPINTDVDGAPTMYGSLAPFVVEHQSPTGDSAHFSSRNI